MDHDPRELRQKVDLLWMATTGAHHPRGSMAWAARIVGVQPRVLRRWCMVGGTSPYLSEVGIAAMRKLELRRMRLSLATKNLARMRLKTYRAGSSRRRFEGETIEEAP